MLWALFPRRQPRRDEARPLPAARHPRLHAFVAEVARALGRRPPAELQLILGSNAFVAGRSGWLRRRSVVGIGLPLLCWLDPDALRSVFAHELGHEHGGDTRLGPWIRRTRLAIGAALDRLEGSSFWLHLPFVAYARLFLGVAAEASRRQELFADALAARLCGVPATARALALIHELADLWDHYVTTEVLPLLQNRICVPLLAGFELYLAAMREPGTLAHSRSRPHARAPAPHDSHPTLEARLAALGVAPPPPARQIGSSVDLLDDVRGAEADAVATLVRRPEELRHLGWPEVGAHGWLPIWKRNLAPYAATLGALVPARLPDVFANLAAWAKRLRRGLAVLSPEAERRRLVGLFGAWLGVRLAGAGFAIESLPGRMIVARRGGHDLEPTTVVTAIADGRLEREEWRRRCRALGI